MLCPEPGSGLPVSEIDADTALLLYALREPGPIPDHLMDRIDGDDERQVAGLVLDRVLEVESPAGFVSGASATALFGAAPGDAGHPLAELSHAALRHAAALRPANQSYISAKLYRYNTLPASPSWRRRLADDIAFLGLSELGPAWTRSGPVHGWHYMSPRRQRPGKSGPKLYVSPRPAALPEAVRATAGAVAEAGGLSFKVGAGVYGALRPDKLVAYFPDLETLRTAAELLRQALDGVPVQGVPFTAALTPDGLLSWGIDPGAAAGDQPKSWRQWLVERLAASLAGAAERPGDDATPAWQAALARLELDGINPNSFRPNASWMDGNR